MKVSEHTLTHSKEGDQGPITQFKFSSFKNSCFSIPERGFDPKIDKWTWAEPFDSCSRIGVKEKSKQRKEDKA